MEKNELDLKKAFKHKKQVLIKIVYLVSFERAICFGGFIFSCDAMNLLCCLQSSTLMLGATKWLA